jgi:acetyl-CoA carboxylase carboxyl transferase subunit beta
MPLFRKKYSDIKVKRREIPDGLWTKCESCSQLIYTKVFIENLKVCPKCNHLHTMGAFDRVEQMIDTGTFIEINNSITSKDPLDFKGARPYSEKISDSQKNTGLKEAALTGEGKIGGFPVVFGVTDSRFIMGSMGSVVGEKITRAIEYAILKRYPLIIVSGSGGGARMEEGCLSLMQMAKTSAALAKLSESGLLFVSVLTNPTMGGVLASFASLGDILIAEPGALIGFAGPRVIKQTIKQELPHGFQKPEFLLNHGLLDMIVQRKQLKATIASLLSLLAYQGN